MIMKSIKETIIKAFWIQGNYTQHLQLAARLTTTKTSKITQKNNHTIQPKFNKQSVKQ